MTAPHPRTVRSGSDLRILRAAVFAAVCVVLAGVGHVLGSCATVPLWTLGAGFLGVLLVTVPFTGRERSLPGIAALLAAGQTVLHTLFGLGQHGAGAGAATGSSATSASLSDAALVEQAARLVCGTAAAAISPAQAQRLLTEARLNPAAGAHASHPSADAMSAATNSSASLLPSLPMVLAHVLAAVVAGWLLRRGDWPCCGSPRCPRCRRMWSPRGRSYVPCAGRSRWCAPCEPDSRARPRRGRGCRAPRRSGGPHPAPSPSSTR